jgi:hypothetical protein
MHGLRGPIARGNMLAGPVRRLLTCRSPLLLHGRARSLACSASSAE